MKKGEPSVFKNIFNAIAFLGVLLILVAIISLIPKTLPNGNEGSAYPGSDRNYPSTLSPEEVCEQWFEYRHDLPRDKKEEIEQDFENCVRARKTPAPLNPSKQIITPSENGIHKFPFYERKAGDGTIVETNLSPFSSEYIIKNQWIREISGEKITVYAGAQRVEPDTGRSLQPENWRSLVIVAATGSNGSPLPDKSGMYYTNQNTGVLRIIEATDSKLTLVGNGGAIFLFDVNSTQIEPQDYSGIKMRAVDDGQLIESNDTPYHFPEYEFENYWIKCQGDHCIIVLAGVKVDEPDQGIIVVVTSSTNDKKIPIEQTIYYTPFKDGIVRIVDSKDQKLTIVGDNGLIFVFDATNDPRLRTFLVTPPGSANELTVISVQSEPKIVDSTPTSVHYPTPLPTYNPYP